MNDSTREESTETKSESLCDHQFTHTQEPNQDPNHTGIL